MTRNKLTIKKVAERLNVSTATISNAFNRPDQLSDKKRREVLAACKAMGYAGPNKAARSLRKGKTNIIALVLPDSLEYTVSDPVASQLIKGVARAIKDSEAKLLLFSDSHNEVEDVIDFVDGFICYGAPRSPNLLSQLQQSHKPIVTIDFDMDGAPSVNIDNTQAAYESAKSALNNTVSRPAILGLRLLDNEQTCVVNDQPLLATSTSISHRRLTGYLTAIGEQGLTIDNHSIWHIPESTHECAIVAAQEALNRVPRPDVLLCMSDIIALSALQEALKLGLRVPQDIRIVGFDGIEEGQRYHPTLATVQQFSANKGEIATRMFLNKDTESQVLPFTLVSGGSA